MRVIQARNVCEALPLGIELLKEHGVRESSRAGPVVVAPWPVTTVYERPTERVLFSALRDANPFFHMAESIWMLAGRDDAGFLNNFVRDFGQRFAEVGVMQIIHGAYGHRWRNAFGFDQLDHVVEVLRKDPSSRQCVIQMWDATPADYFDERGYDDLRGSWRDRPCNTHAYLRVRDDRDATAWPPAANPEPKRVLDLTVLCRSNDIIWGAYGANAVHFSVLQEYLAARIGVGVGTYYQVSNNFHMYEAEVHRLEERIARETLAEALRDNRYGTDLRSVELNNAIVDDPSTFDSELAYLFNSYDCLGEGPPDSSIDAAVIELRNKFLGQTVWPALRAHGWFKAKQYTNATDWAQSIQAHDWRVACTEWLQRRIK